MTGEELYELLRQSGADAFEITDEETYAHEYYLIRHALDQHRVRKTRDLRISVFKKTKEGMLGNAEGAISPTHTREECEKEIGRLLANAAHAVNPYYRLHTGTGHPPVTDETLSPDIAAIAANYLEAVRDMAESDETFLNSCEIFAEEKTVRFRLKPAKVLLFGKEDGCRIQVQCKA